MARIPLADFKEGVVRAVQRSGELQQAAHVEDRRRIEALTAELMALKERLGAKEEIEAEQSRGTAKGRDFEERIHALLDEIATARGDVAHHVGDQAGETRGKKGDTVVEIGAGAGPCLAKIAFDPKDSQLTRPEGLGGPQRISRRPRCGVRGVGRCNRGQRAGEDPEPR